MAKRKSLFDDKPVEIQELTYIIKQDIKSLNEKIAQLQTVSRVLLKSAMGDLCTYIIIHLHWQGGHFLVFSSVCLVNLIFEKGYRYKHHKL